MEATFGADNLDTLGRIIDFGTIRERLGQWIDNNWDHATILHEKDRALGDAISAKTSQVIFYLPTNPTAENMAAYLLQEVCPTLFAGTGARCTHLRLYETPNCYAEVKE